MVEWCLNHGLLSDFPQNEFAITSDPLPSVSLTYPSGTSEEFLLLTPKTSNEYDPIHELAQIVRTIYRGQSSMTCRLSDKADQYILAPVYVPPSHAHLFEADTARSASHATTSPQPGSPFTPSRAITPSTPLPESATGTPDRAEEPILRSLQRALNRRDGPGFVHTIERFNGVMALLRVHDMRAWLEVQNGGGAEGISRAEWEGLVDVLGGQVYQRVVGPQSEGLKGYVPFSDNVYGELLPRWVWAVPASHSTADHPASQVHDRDRQ